MFFKLKSHLSGNSQISKSRSTVYDGRVSNALLFAHITIAVSSSRITSDIRIESKNSGRNGRLIKSADKPLNALF